MEIQLDNEKNEIDIEHFFKWLKNKCSSKEYKVLRKITVIDFIINYININDYTDDEIIIFIDNIVKNKIVLEFIEIECRDRRVLIERDYGNKNVKNIKIIHKTKKINLMALFKRV